jgi:hypothetical protein
MLIPTNTRKARYKINILLGKKINKLRMELNKQKAYVTQ